MSNLPVNQIICGDWGTEGKYMFNYLSLYKRIACEGLDENVGYGFWGNRFGFLLKSFNRYFCNSVCIDISPIKHLFENPNYNPHKEILPIFSNIWFEDYTNYRKEIIILKHPPKTRFGILCHYEKIPPELNGGFIYYIFPVQGISGTEINKPFLSPTISIFCVNKDGMTLNLNENKILLEKLNIIPNSQFIEDGDIENKYISISYNAPNIPNEPFDEISVDVGAVARLFAFLQAKNIHLERRLFETSVVKRLRSKYNKQDCTYRILTITKPGVNIKTDKKINQSEKPLPLHLVRGHLRRYENNGICKGLFGKQIFGTFYIPSHTRGNLEQGILIKDYKAKTSHEQSRIR